MPFEITILGSNSAIPSHGRHPSAQAININDKWYLADCGEATQIQLSKYKIRSGKINHIFISHLHGDHFFGLIGLLTSYHLLRRDKPLCLYAPPELMEIIQVQLKHSQTQLAYELKFYPTQVEKSEVVFENEDITVETIIMNHRIPCTGFLFREKQHPRKILPDKIEQYKVPLTFIAELKKGKDFTDAGGTIIKNSLLTADPPQTRAYAYCPDTLYHENIIPQVQNIDLLYHESTFGNDSAARAKETFHSTAEQAAIIAKKAGVKKLIIGHFSAKYEDLAPLLKEARLVFANTELAVEGARFSIEKTQLGNQTGI